jgi:putative ABC transport system permease protein
VRPQRAARAGRFLTPGLPEIVVGRNAATAYTGLDLGSSVRIGPGTWQVVGLFDAGGSAFDSEIWADATVLNGAYQRPPGVFQSITARLASVATSTRSRRSSNAIRGCRCRSPASATTTRHSRVR